MIVSCPRNNMDFVAILDTQPADDEDRSNFRSGFPRSFGSLLKFLSEQLGLNLFALEPAAYE